MNDILTAYLAPPGFAELLCKELKNIRCIYDRLVLAEGAPQKVYWAQNIWYDAKTARINSISDAAKILRGVQRNWWPYEFQHFRRMRLIKEQLPYIAGKPLDFLAPVPKAPLGSWTLLDESTLFFASSCESAMPNGEWLFNEDKINPPSRAYLKLWEFFTRFNVHPTKSEICLELGASPGGWTWVLASLAGKVFAFDKSPLDDRVMALDNVSFKIQDAFKINNSDYERATWIFSDVICYPDKLYDFIVQLLMKFPDKKYVFTIKFQGPEHGDIVSRFAALPGQIVHLSNNKHELTWFKL